MPGRTYTQSSLSDIDALSILSGISGNRASGASRHIQNDSASALGRRKTYGLNSRFDRMMDTVNIMHTHSHGKPGRLRAASSSSASVTSYDVPKTPVDAYSDLSEGRLGEEFSVQKMKSSAAAVNQLSDCRDMNDGGDAVRVDRNRKSRPPLPPWLRNTFLSLDRHHPLRVLLPSNMPSGARDQDSSSPLPVTNNLVVSPVLPADKAAHEEEPVFAFYPPQVQPSFQPTVPETTVVHMTNMTAEEETHRTAIFSPARVVVEPRNVPHSPAEKSLVASLLDENVLGSGAMDVLPFSTAGPAHPSSTASTTTTAISVIPSAIWTTPQTITDSLLAAAQFDASSPDEANHSDADVLPFSKPGPLAPQRHIEGSAVSSSRIPALLQSLGIPPSHDAYPLYPATPAQTPQTNWATLPQTHSHGKSAKRSHALAFENRDSPEPVPQRPMPMPPSHPPLNFTISPRPLHPSLHSALARQPTLVLERQSSPREKPYCIPGPAHGRPKRVSPKRVYFDTPAEDPCSSDPMDEGDYMLALDYDLDVKALGFKWERFDRGDEAKKTGSSDSSLAREEGREHVNLAEDAVFSFGVTPGSRSHTPPTPPNLMQTADDGSPVLDDGVVVYGYDEEDDELCRLIIWSDNVEHSHGLPGQYGHPGSSSGTGKSAKIQASSSSKPPSPPRGSSFAPAPGIFISPLRGEVEDEEEHEDRSTGRPHIEESEEQVDEDTEKPDTEIPLSGRLAHREPITPVRSTKGRTPYESQEAVSAEPGRKPDRHNVKSGSSNAASVVEATDAGGSAVGSQETKGPDYEDVEAQASGLASTQMSHDSIESWTEAEAKEF